MRKITATLLLLVVATTAFAQMDMLPEIFRDLPPELQKGLPSDMTYEHYRHMTRNVDFFTMFMSMFVPGYGLYQVERPGAATAVLSARVVSTGLMATAIIRQWSDLRDFSQVQEISEEDYRSLMLNVALFTGGIIGNGMGWAIDVLAAYHIAKAEKDYVLYRYGLISEVEGDTEQQLRTYLLRTLPQEDNKLRLRDDLERYLHEYPDGLSAGEMAFYLGSLTATEGDYGDAFAYLLRSVFAYQDHDFTRAAEQMLATIIHRNRTAWAADWDELWSIVELRDSAGETIENRQVENRYRELLGRIEALQSDYFHELFVQEATYFLWRFPGSRFEADILYRLGRMAASLERESSVVASLASVIYAYPDSGVYFQAVYALGSYYQNVVDRPELAVRIFEFALREANVDSGTDEQVARQNALEQRAELLDNG